MINWYLPVQAALQSQPPIVVLSGAEAAAGWSGSPVCTSQHVWQWLSCFIII